MKKVLVLVDHTDDYIYIYEGESGEDDKNPTLEGEAIMYTYKKEALIEYIVTNFKEHGYTMELFEDSFIIPSEDNFVLDEIKKNIIQQKRYEGNFKDNKREGDGTLFTYDNGRLIKVFEGEWLQNVSLKGSVIFYTNKPSPEWIYNNSTFDHDDPDKIKTAIVSHTTNADIIWSGTIEYITDIDENGKRLYQAELEFIGGYPSDVFHEQEVTKVVQVPGQRLKYIYKGPIIMDNNGELKSVDESRWKPGIEEASAQLVSAPSTPYNDDSEQEFPGGKKTHKRKYQKRKQTRKISRRPRKRSKNKKTRK